MRSPAKVVPCGNSANGFAVESAFEFGPNGVKLPPCRHAAEAIRQRLTLSINRESLDSPHSAPSQG